MTYLNVDQAGPFAKGQLVRNLNEQGARFTVQSVAVDPDTQAVKWVNVYGGVETAKGKYYAARAFHPDKLTEAKLTKAKAEVAARVEHGTDELAAKRKAAAAKAVATRKARLAGVA